MRKMANKYCNLDGSKKIKDEYEKINIGFDRVEEDIKDIIVTPAEGVSEQEIIQARKGRGTLGTRLDEIDSNIDSLGTTIIANYNTLDTKINTTKDNLDTRIDNIIATPTTVSEQEIIDARQGKASLGANLTAIKDDLAQHKLDYATLEEYIKQATSPLVNLVKNGDFSKGLDGWLARSSYATNTIVGGYLRSTKKGERPYFGRIDGYNIPANHKIYFSFNLRGNKNGRVYIRMHSVDFSTADSNIMRFDIGVEDVKYSTILTTTDVFNGFSLDGVDYTVDGDYIEIRYPLIIDLTAVFGLGKEPSVLEMDNLLSKYPNSWFDTIKPMTTLGEVNNEIKTHEAQIESIKNEVLGNKVDIIKIIDKYDGLVTANQFISLDGTDRIIISEDIINKYADYDIVISNRTDTPLRLAFRSVTLSDDIGDPTIRLANGEYAKFHTSISDDAAQIIIPPNCISLNISQIPIQRLSDGMEAYDNHIWKKYRGKLSFQVRSVSENSVGGTVTIWFVGYKK